MDTEAIISKRMEGDRRAIAFAGVSLSGSEP